MHTLYLFPTSQEIVICIALFFLFAGTNFNCCSANSKSFYVLFHSMTTKQWYDFPVFWPIRIRSVQLQTNLLSALNCILHLFLCTKSSTPAFMLFLLDISTSAKYDLHRLLQQHQEGNHQGEAANTMSMTWPRPVFLLSWIP